eukprot:1151426-Pelagomonas_calceolata.AAC.2
MADAAKASRGHAQQVTNLAGTGAALTFRRLTNSALLMVGMKSYSRMTLKELDRWWFSAGRQAGGSS